MSESAPKKSRACPECGKMYHFVKIADKPSYPFCSDRCKSVDLGAWLSEDYRIVEEVSMLPPSIDDMPDEEHWA